MTNEQRASLNPSSFAVDDSEETLNSDSQPLPDPGLAEETEDNAGNIIALPAAFQVDANTGVSFRLNADGTYTYSFTPEQVLQLQVGTLRLPQQPTVTVTMPTTTSSAVSPEPKVKRTRRSSKQKAEDEAREAAEAQAAKDADIARANAEVQQAQGLSSSIDFSTSMAAIRAAADPTLPADQTTTADGTNWNGLAQVEEIVSTPADIQLLNRWQGDPVGFSASRQAYYHSDEVWSQFFGPFATIEVATESLNAYIAWLQSDRSTPSPMTRAQAQAQAQVQVPTPIPAPAPTPIVTPIAPPAPVVAAEDEGGPPKLLNLAIQWNEQDELLKRLQAHAMDWETYNSEKKVQEGKAEEEKTKIAVGLTVLANTMQATVPGARDKDIGRIVLSDVDEDGKRLIYGRVVTPRTTISEKLLLSLGVSTDIIRAAKVTNYSVYWQVSRVSDKTLHEQGVVQEIEAPNYLAMQVPPTTALQQ